MLIMKVKIRIFGSDFLIKNKTEFFVGLMAKLYSRDQTIILITTF